MARPAGLGVAILSLLLIIAGCGPEGTEPEDAVPTPPAVVASPRADATPHASPAAGATPGLIGATGAAGAGPTLLPLAVTVSAADAEPGWQTLSVTLGVWNDAATPAALALAGITTGTVALAEGPRYDAALVSGLTDGGDLFLPPGSAVCGLVVAGALPATALMVARAQIPEGTAPEQLLVADFAPVDLRDPAPAGVCGVDSAVIPGTLPVDLALAGPGSSNQARLRIPRIEANLDEVCVGAECFGRGQMAVIPIEIENLDRFADFAVPRVELRALTDDGVLHAPISDPLGGDGCANPEPASAAIVVGPGQTVTTRLCVAAFPERVAALTVRSPEHEVAEIVRIDPAHVATPAPPPAPGTVLYSAGQAGGFEAWTLPDDRQPRDGMLVSAPAADGLLAAPYEVAVSVPAYAVEAEIEITEVAASPVCELYVGIAGGRYLAAVTYDTCAAAPGGQTSARIVDTLTDEVLAEQPFTPEPGWHTYRLEVRGGAVRLLVDGSQLLTATGDRGRSPDAAGLDSFGVGFNARRFEIIALDDARTNDVTRHQGWITNF